MQTESKASMKSFLLGAGLLICLAFALLACSSLPNLFQRETAWVELNEDDLLALLQEQTASLGEPEGLLAEITRVQIMKYQVEVTGTYTRSDGKRAEAVYLLGLEIKEGELFATVLNYNIEGATEKSQVEPLEQALTAALVRTIAQEKEAVQFDWVEIGPDLVRVKISYR